ncbi:unnamed protein product [Sympodiomycopsis kandeliae]
MVLGASNIANGPGVPSSSAAPEEGLPPWRRILYERQPYPDWYFPPEENATKVETGPREPENFTHLTIVIAILPLIQHINLIFIFLEIFDQLEQTKQSNRSDDGPLHPARLIFWCLVVTIVGSIVARVTHYRHQDKRKKKGRKRTSSNIISFAILLLLLYSLSPVLKTLTEATTSDTIYPLSFMLFGLHICLADNTLKPIPKAFASKTNGMTTSAAQAQQQQPQLFSALSLNAATSASLVLASRLPSNSHVFALMFSSILAFALFSSFTKRLIQSNLIRLLVVLGLVVTAICASTLHSVRSTAMVITATNGFFFFVVPYWMKVASKKKKRYSGPWKVATPRLARNSTTNSAL